MNRTLVFRERSFRDPGGFVFRNGPRLLRAVEPSAFETLKQFLASTPGRDFVASRLLVATNFPDTHEFASNIPKDYQLAEHEAVAFPSFPAEWPIDMLASAGFLTLDLAEQCLPHCWQLKDATPYNVLFRGPSPIFVDVLSFERRDPQNAIWPAYAQFERTFLLPLLALSSSPTPHLWLAHRDGLEPEQVYRSLPWSRRLSFPGLSLASLPTWFASRAESDPSLYLPRTTDPARASFTRGAMLRRLRRQLHRLASAHRVSHWSKYLDTQTHYTAQQFAAKESFVDSVLSDFPPRRVLDIGANTGHFSERAALAGAGVVAIDSDSAAAGQLWQRAVEKKLDILPLVVDLSRPTPALGWRNRESRSFLDRASGEFDLVMMLAVVHHLLVTERVPLEEILQLASELTTDFLLLEFVEPADPMFRRLARGRDALYAHLTASHFESASQPWFQIIRKQPIAGSSRTLYLLRRNI
ncbi:MAG TPA: methyltransferase domain-containing protein [Bryobacteraceae bacterium]|jgi:SAM-dependent methyltransferase|nr:methyltransferase domain-containing protein [Bryobacteraceae bacterium]